MNYTELSTAIQDYTENYDATFVANIPVFVKAAEKKIYNAVELPAISEEASPTMTLSDKYVAVPDDFIYPFEFAIVVSGSWKYLRSKEMGFLREAYPSPTATGEPKYYALYDETKFVVAPTPSSGYTTFLRYARYPTSIVTAGTTWLGTNYDQLLLYGALIEAYLFMKGEEDVMKGYLTRYTDLLNDMKVLTGGKMPVDAFKRGQLAGG